MNPFNFNTSASVRFGPGLLSQIGSITKVEIGSRVLLVTDPGMMATGIVDKALASFEQSGIEVTLFQDVQADPPEEVIISCSDTAIECGAQGIIGLGGGSSLDVAKLAALLALGNQTLNDAYGVGNAKGPRLPLVLIPTTSGTGSEVTPVSIVTTGANTKMGVVSPVILPDIALLDPELTIGLPSHITAATGIDAMVHAIEAYASASPNNNPISRNLAKEALRLMGGALETAVHNGSDIKARSDMLLGSMMAGQAFANSPVAAVHALAYPLGGHFHIPHGLSNALVLPHVLKFNIETSPQPYAELAPYLFPELEPLDMNGRAVAFCNSLAELSRKCGLQQSLKEMNVSQEMLPVLADDVMNQTRLLVNNPRPVNREDALRIYEQAF